MQESDIEDPSFHIDLLGNRSPSQQELTLV